MTSIGAPFPAAIVRGTLTDQRRDWWGMVFLALLLGSLLLTLAILFVLLADVVNKAIPVFAERGTDFLTSTLSSNPANAGVAQGLIGTALLAVIVSLIAFPVGV